MDKASSYRHRVFAARWQAMRAATAARRRESKPSAGRRAVTGLTALRTILPAAALDALAVALAYEVAALLRFDGLIPPEYAVPILLALPVILAIHLAVNTWQGIYARAWQYGGLMDVLALARATGVAGALVLVADIALGTALQKRPVPITVALAGSVFTFLAIGGAKLAPRIRERLSLRAQDGGAERVLIVGAGHAGQSLVRQLQHSFLAPAAIAARASSRSSRAAGTPGGVAQSRYLPVCFVDDDARKRYLHVHGVPVLGTRHDIPPLVREHAIDIVAVAIPSAPGTVIREIVDVCRQTEAKVRIVPGVAEVLDGRAAVGPLREITVEDLLGREPVTIDVAACSAYVAGQVVLVTGAAGSIGSELARQVLGLEPRRLVLLDNDESRLFELELHLTAGVHDPRVVPVVCNVVLREALLRVFAAHRPDVIFHAAAYKHVPLMERQADQAVLVNVVGTANVCLAAEACGAERLVLVSTDKAVNATNVMGATKRLCEHLILTFGGAPAHGGYDDRARVIASGTPARAAPPLTVAMAADAARNTGIQVAGNEKVCAGVLYCAVRFGNVLDSRGSVVPTFAWQIDRGGPVTVTHPEIRRYFMTIPEAASLVMQAAAFSSGGDVFLLDMGEEMNIAELAEKMILMRGLRPGKDVEIVFTGLRPGEKLREELIQTTEVLLPTPHPKINRVASGSTIRLDALLAHVDQLRRLAEAGESELLRDQLFELIRDYDTLEIQQPETVLR